MKENDPTIEQFWQAYLDENDDLAIDPNDIPEAWAFGEGRKMADELSQLVFLGTKTATCSLLWEYVVDKEPLPQEGDLSIILDGDSFPVCLIETTEVQIRAFDQVSPQFAYDEGEGDRSLEYWQQAHWRHFEGVCARIGRQLDVKMPLVCERFRVLYPSPNRGEKDPPLD